MAALAWALSSVCPTTPATATTRLSPAAVLALAGRGLSGDYEATYALSGQLAVFPGPNWTVVVAHEGPAPVARPSITDDGIWSFFLHAGDGYRLQWVEKGQRFQQCWTMAGRPGWHCGRGTYETSNGFSLATLPYIPESVVINLEAVLDGPSGREQLSAYRLATRRYGPLACLSAVSRAPAELAAGTTSRHPFVTTCLTTRGLVADQRQWGEGTWDNLTLVTWRPRPPASDFQPVSAVGPSSELPPL